jgi:uncharacterized membrane protein YccC
MGGTLAGSFLGSLFVWIRMPTFLLGALTGLMAFCFAYFLKRRYGVAVFFVTLMLVLVTGTMAPVHLDFTVTRLLCNLAGGTVALISAVVFWPIWEGQKFTALLAAAIRANRVYLDSIFGLHGPTPAGVDLLMPKRRAENANRYALASLQRMLAEPRGRTEAGERAAALATYNQRITRAFTAIVAGLPNQAPVGESAFAGEARQIGDTLETLACVVEGESCGPSSEDLRGSLAELENFLSQSPAPALSAAGPPAASQLIQTHLAKSVVEIRAMTLALDSPSSPTPVGTAASSTNRMPV